MLAREDAQKQLEQERIKGWQAQAAAEVAAALPEALRPIAYALLERDQSGTPLPSNTNEERQRQHTAVAQGYAQLGKWGAEDRLAIFAALLPGVATHLEAGWVLRGRLPYQTSYQRRAFRLRDETATAASVPRTQWLTTILAGLGPYRQRDVRWVAAWAPYLGGYHGSIMQPIGLLCAAAIDAGGPEGQEVFETLTACARGEHPIGTMGRHVTTALLVAARPDGWDFVERLLLAAQREEGLRQVILETVDEAHPQAFRRLLRLILDQDLIRFSATIRAADVWFGFGWDVDDARAARDTLSQALVLLDDPAARDALLAPQQTGAADAAADPTPRTAAAQRKAEEAARAAHQAGARDLYVALWATAFEDALGAIGAAGPALSDTDPLRRLAAAQLLAMLDLPQARAALLPLLDDPDLRVALCAFGAMRIVRNHWQATDGQAAPAPDPELFGHFERLLARLDGKQPALESGLWPWLRFDAKPETVADALLEVLGERPATLLLAHLPRMSAWAQVRAAKRLAETPVWDARIREVLLGMASDRSSYVRDEALKLIAARPLAGEDALPLERLLTRKGSETRRALLTMLLKQPDQGALASAGRLLAARDARQRLAGLDLLRELAQAGRQVPACREAACGYQATWATPTADERPLLAAIMDAGQPEAAAPSLKNVLGLIDPAGLTSVIWPEHRSTVVDTPAARAYIAALDMLVEANRTAPVVSASWQGSEEQLLGNIRWFPTPDAGLSANADRANLPLVDIWERWDSERPAASRDTDGMEPYRALLLLSASRVAQATGAGGVLGMLRSPSARTLRTGRRCGRSSRSLGAPSAPRYCDRDHRLAGPPPRPRYQQDHGLPAPRCRAGGRAAHAKGTRRLDHGASRPATRLQIRRSPRRCKPEPA